MAVRSTYALSPAQLQEKRAKEVAALEARRQALAQSPAIIARRDAGEMTPEQARAHIRANLGNAAMGLNPMQAQAADATLAQHKAQTQQTLATARKTRQEADVAIPAAATGTRLAGLGALGQGVGAAVKPLADAFSAYQGRRAASDTARLDSETQKYSAAKQVEAAKFNAIAKPPSRQYMDPAIDAQIKGIDQQIEALEPYLYSKPKYGEMTRNDDAFGQYERLLEARQKALQPQAPPAVQRAPLASPPAAPPADAEPAAMSAAPTDEDIEFTARKYGLSIDEVKRRLGLN